MGGRRGTGEGTGKHSRRGTVEGAGWAARNDTSSTMKIQVVEGYAEFKSEGAWNFGHLHFCSDDV